MGELPARNTAENTQRVARGRQPERYHVAHHQQVRQRFMAVTVNQQVLPAGAAYIPTILFEVEVPLVTI
jgi:hypothetical protein